ncbi:MAG: glycine oxidase ThiO [Acidobacteriaceae bacterium]
MKQVDICIAGAGIIGLSLAMELRRRGRSVLVLEQGYAMREASWAAAGMLAAYDPENPSVLTSLAELSLRLYPAFRQQIETLSGLPVAFRTRNTLQALDTVPAHGITPVSASEIVQLAPHVISGNRSWVWLQEHSLDPRDLCLSLPKASVAIGSEMLEHTAWLSIQTGKLSPKEGKILIQTTATPVLASTFVLCTGAWAGQSQILAGAVSPRKGQMLTVALPASVSLNHTVRTPEIYLVPRGDGRVVIGATVEDAGFDKSTDTASIQQLLRKAAELVPAVADATLLEQWSGLRPGTADILPILGQLPDERNVFVATGHYRNGILLAPATAHVMAELICGETPSVDLAPFSPERFVRRGKFAEAAV